MTVHFFASSRYKVYMHWSADVVAFAIALERLSWV